MLNDSNASRGISAKRCPFLQSIKQIDESMVMTDRRKAIPPRITPAKTGLKTDLENFLRKNERGSIEDFREIYKKYYKKNRDDTFREVISHNLYEMESEFIVRCEYDKYGYVKEAIYIKGRSQDEYKIDYNFIVTHEMIEDALLRWDNRKDLTNIGEFVNEKGRRN